MTVCLCAVHPLALAEFERHLKGHGFLIRTRRLDTDPAAKRDPLPMPSASAYVLEAHESPPTSEELVNRVLAERAGARVIVAAEKLEERTAFPLLRIGVKGLLAFSEAADQLARAVREVAAGGFWVPRSLLSRFVDDALAASKRVGAAPPVGRVSKREREVLEMLLENLSNKEIAARLHLSERTVKFHVSNLLGKYGVKRRADLIVLTYAGGRERPAS